MEGSLEGRLKRNLYKSKEYDTREMDGYSSPERLDQPKTRPLIADRIVGNAFPDKRLNSLSVVTAEVQKSDRKLVAGNPDHQS